MRLTGKRVLMVVILVLLILILLTYFVLLRLLPPRPCENLLPNEDKSGITVVLIDVSDMMKVHQVRRLAQVMKRITEPNKEEPHLAQGETLVVFFLDGEGKPPTKEFEMCNPGKNWWGCGIIRGKNFCVREWKKFFDDSQSKIDEKISENRTLSTSPILEAIEVIREEFPPPQHLTEGKNYSIKIWSDMLQNSEKGNFYIEVAGSWRDTPVNLDGIVVTVNKIIPENESKRRTGELREWWMQFFDEAKAADLIWIEF